MRFSFIAALGAVGLAAAFPNNTTTTAHSTTKSAVSSTHLSSALSTHTSSSISVHSTKTTSHSAVSTTTHPAGPDHGKVICYGDFCVEEDCHGDHCKKFQVVCCGDVCKLEICIECQINFLVICNGNGTNCDYSRCKGDECNRKIICINGNCNREVCKGDECNFNCVCTGADCIFKKCDDQCHQMIKCNDDKCKPQPAPTGKPAPRPNPPAPTKSNGDVKPTKPAAPTTSNHVVIAGADKVAIGSSVMLGAAVFMAMML